MYIGTVYMSAPQMLLLTYVYIQYLGNDGMFPSYDMKRAVKMTLIYRHSL